ncbi:hypothetical protein EON81_14190 [bacterium]|nr:MAG: hypothetical protein EON81_14190 [bacterium]
MLRSAEETDAIGDFARLIARLDGRFRYEAERVAEGINERRSTAVADWRTHFDDLLRHGHSGSYSAGLRLGGEDPDDRRDDVSDVGKALRDLESYYTAGFENDLVDGHTPLLDPETGLVNPDRVHARMRMYAGRMRGTANAGFADGSSPDSDVWWRLGPKAEVHCPDCPVLADASPWRPDTLGTTPGGNDTACLFHCNCDLEIEGITGFQAFGLGPASEVAPIGRPKTETSQEEPVLLPA